jgi:hypothetical protein
VNEMSTQSSKGTGTAQTRMRRMSDPRTMSDKIKGSVRNEVVEEFKEVRDYVKRCTNTIRTPRNSALS